MRATVTPTDQNMIQIEIEVEEPELALAMDDTAKRLSREISVKGFRKGKVPRQVIEARIGGHGALRSEAIRSSINDFYAAALSEAEVEPINQPQLSITGGEDEGNLTLEAIVEVRPEVFLIGHRDLRVTIPSPVVPDEEVDAQIQRIRETDAQLVDVDRPVQLGDVIIADVKAIDPAGQHETVELEDYSYDVGSRALSEGLDEVIVGHVVGDTVEAGARRGPNEFIAYEVTIKQNRERVLADFTDEWVGENTDYETIDELRDGIITQLQKRRLVEAQLARRDATLAALAELVDAEIVPDALVSSELEHRLNDLGQRLEQRGLSFEYFLQISGQSADQLVEALRADALRAVRVDLALRGLVKAENLEATDEEIEQELVETAVSIEISPPALRESLRVNGRTAGFASEVAKMKASKWILEHASYVDEAGIEIDRALLDTDQSASVQTEPDNA